MDDNVTFPICSPFGGFIFIFSLISNLKNKNIEKNNYSNSILDSNVRYSYELCKYCKFILKKNEIYD